MTDKEIIKALQICIIKGNCNDCPYEPIGQCVHAVEIDALDLISRQKAKIERLAEILSNTIRIRKNEVRTEAINEFAERLKTKKFKYRTFGELVYVLGELIRVDEIDSLVKEMVGEE